jgi:hypothetical protein
LTLFPLPTFLLTTQMTPILQWKWIGNNFLFQVQMKRTHISCLLVLLSFRSHPKRFSSYSVRLVGNCMVNHHICSSIFFNS